MSSETAVTTYPALPKADCGEVPLLNRSTPWKTHHCRGQPAEPDSPLMQTGSCSSWLSYYLWARHREGQPKYRCFYGWAPWWSYPKIGELKREMLIYTCAWHMHLYGREGCPTTGVLFKEPQARQEALRGNSRQTGKAAARFEEVKSPVSCAPRQRSNPLLPPRFRSEQEGAASLNTLSKCSSLRVPRHPSTATKQFKP